MFCKAGKYVCTVNGTDNNRRSEKCQKKCEENGQKIHGRISEENGESARKKIWSFMSASVISSVIRQYWR